MTDQPSYQETTSGTSLMFEWPTKLPQIELANGRRIGDGTPCFIVAEVGQNHNGNMVIAHDLIRNVASHQVDAVKLCKRHIASELTAEAYARPYDGPQSFGQTYGEHREFLELSIEQYAELKAATEGLGLVFFASACDRHSVDDLESIDVPLYKVASRDLSNLPLLDYIAQTNKPVILSSGMASMRDVELGVAAIRQRHDKIVVLQCTSAYPTPMRDVNIRAMHTLRQRLGVLVGMSDHTVGYMVALASTALGACVVEKHVTLSRTMKGTDHSGSLESEGVRRLVRDIRNFEIALGSGEKVVEPIVRDAQIKLERSLVSMRAIEQGATLTADDVVLKSPGDGITWRDRDRIIGKRALRPIAADTKLRPEDFG